MTIQTHKIIGLLRELRCEADFLFLEKLLHIRRNIQNIIKDNNLTREQACKLFEITDNEYDDYTIGAWNYSIEDMALINAAFMKFEVEKLKNKL